METQQYLDVFLEESREHLQSVNDNILSLEKNPENLDLVQEIFRSAHTLKGMAATMGYEDIASLTHKMENVLDLIRNGELPVTTAVIDIIFQAIECLEEMVDSISEGLDGKRDVTALVEQLGKIESGERLVDSGQAVQNKEAIISSEELGLDEYQLTVIEQGQEQGFLPYRVKVTLTEDCILKGARAYMVFETLEGKGDIILTEPSVEEIEEGDFGQDFSMLVLTAERSEEIIDLISKVSEVERVKMEQLLKGQSEEQKSGQRASEQPVQTSKPTAAAFPESSEKEAVQKSNSKTIRVNLEKIDDLLNLFEEVVIDRSRLEVIADNVSNKELSETIEHMNRVSADMQSLILAMRMVPVEQVFNRFPRMVRGLAKDLDKKINLQIFGADTELDRTVIDEIGDPLVHLLRNSVDHGIELPEVREQAGKEEAGNILLRAFHSGNHVFIEIEDDGAGINRAKVQAKAIERGLITEAEAQMMQDEEIHRLILAPGFSTADTVSDISGRGVGLDVVKNKIESLGGHISIEAREGKGSIFSIQLPLTLSIIVTLLVKVQEETFAIPLSSIIETVKLDKNQVLSAHGKQVMDFRGKIVPLVALQEVFDIPVQETEETGEHAVVIIKKGEKLTGLIVDSFIGQKEIVLKSLGEYLKDVFAISGATILGDGEVSLVLDPNALIK